MSIVLPESLPATRVLLGEGVKVVSGDRLHDEINRPLRICLVNLMPNKQVTETQISRLLGAASVPVELVLCVPDSIGQRTHPLITWQPSIGLGRKSAISL
jgi:homoserine O-succinyltransferase